MNRQIYKGRFKVDCEKSMAERLEWWKGLGEELETDIESFDESGS